MSFSTQYDPEILVDFLTEANELIESLDKDLVLLEHSSSDLELLNRIFRGLHTIKGSSSFLGLPALTQFAHAAEDALNALRKGQSQVTPTVMDALLSAVDVVRGQLNDIQHGAEPSQGPAALVERLHQIGRGEIVGAGPATAAERASSTAAAAGSCNEPAREQLTLPDSKREILSFMVDDLVESLNQIEELLEQVHTPDDQRPVAARMAEITSGLMRSVDFFEIEVISHEVHALDEFAQALPSLAEPALVQARARVQALLAVLLERAEALREFKLLRRPTDKLLQRLAGTLVGQALDVAAQLAASTAISEVLRIDEVVGGAPSGAGAAAGEAPADGEVTTLAALAAAAAGAADPGAMRAALSGEGSRALNDQTIRVDVGRLEALLNLIGELVLQKNRILAMSRRLIQQGAGHELCEDFSQVASDLDRVTGELQLGVMKTRMQPLSKLFNRYQRLIRDIAREADKQIELTIVGGETEVDKSVIELLNDPMVHILRNSADHGIESAEERLAAGKPAEGRVELRAGHEGNHVLVVITDDGRGLNVQRIGQKAVERGLVTPEELALMPENAIWRFIFAPGFSTAEKVSNLSGRGVGMDVVKTNISKMNGSIDVTSVAGQGTTITIRIPLTVAIMQAMMVGVGQELYAVPLSNILEIVKPREDQVQTINGKPVMRLRQQVLPLVDLAALFGHEGAGSSPYAVVVSLGEQRIGLMVHRLVGQQEVVIKPLDTFFELSNMLSGATVREDGGVSLIVDVPALIKAAEMPGAGAGAPMAAGAATVKGA